MSTMSRNIVPIRNIQKWIPFIQGKRNQSNLSYKHCLGESPLIPLTIGQLLGKTVKQYGDQIAIISKHQNKSITYKELLRKADTLAAGLSAMNLIKGDKIGLWASNSIEWEIAFMACIRIGAICVLLNPAYKRKEIEFCINKVGLKCIISEHTYRDVNYYEVLNEISGNLDQCQPGNLKSTKVPTLQSVIILTDDCLKGTYNLEEMFTKTDETKIKLIEKNQSDIHFDDPCNIQFTSGTTGEPKAPLLTHFNFVNNSYGLVNRCGLEPSKKHQTICMQVPYFHTFGLTAGIVGTLHFGSTQIIPSPMFNATKSLEAIAQEKCTIIYGTPTMYVDLINVQKELKLDIYPDMAGCGAAPSSPSLLTDILEILNVKKVVSLFGMTETTALSFASFLNDSPDQVLNTVGHVQNHLEVKVVDHENKLVPFGVAGELCVRGYSTMLEYYGDSDRTKAILKNDKWLKTGDKFILYENGYGKMVGRMNDMINRGGENIYPVEIENVLNRHPDIIESQIVGMPHERMGEEVCACVRIIPNSKLDLNQITEFCKNEMAYFKIPSKLFIFTEFPKTASGKIQKFRIVETLLKKDL